MEAAHQHQELAVALAALLIHEAGKEITAEHINTVLHHSNIKVEGFWPIIMAKALANANIEDLIMDAGSAPVAAAPAAGAAPAAQNEATEEKKEDKKEEEEAEEDFGGFGDLF
ncbi:hypothetical protein ENUP19_0247G0018 [Entamoeba nuttalli]|uniref:60S acidic ribosomal protein P1, putative n=2 Tax=Entamoeba nuttalli TaxID=412467 RepID=K2GTW3_ENTNP|nr:60S acidic ribosomal protein P1, putative [Entamoeba nuttalli P19]EKE37252.1 60S acidic ribosomal protein P1, putative [Entamoeba nuttalli P19]|eukprot:XP_008860410.1 60S acidic ribosomal protein P1, putative [Entamoeba nuttalli P19]